MESFLMPRIEGFSTEMRRDRNPTTINLSSFHGQVHFLAALITGYYRDLCT